MNGNSKFKESILVDIENHPYYIDYNIFKIEGSLTTSTKKKKKMENSS